MAGKRKSTTAFVSGCRPNNAKILDFQDIGDLVRKLGAEKKKVSLNGQAAEMTWAERSLRLTLDRAINGNVRDLALLLRLMTEHPDISGSEKKRIIYVVRSALANV